VVVVVARADAAVADAVVGFAKRCCVPSPSVYISLFTHTLTARHTGRYSVVYSAAPSQVAMSPMLGMVALMPST
jgi:hypothetical protein